MDDLTYFALQAILAGLFLWGLALLVAEVRKILRLRRRIRSLFED